MGYYKKTMQKEYKLYSGLSYKSKLDKNKKENSSWKVYMSVMQGTYEIICFNLCKKCGLIDDTKRLYCIIAMPNVDELLHEQIQQVQQCIPVVLGLDVKIK